MPSSATPEGTRRYAARFAGRCAEGHFPEAPGTASGPHGSRLVVSSLGIGTYLGEPDARTDEGYTNCVVAAVEGGINVIDSAINYRFQRSERAVGAALKTLASRGFAREELVICTKAGYLTPDGEMPANPSEYFFREYIEPGVMRADEIAAGSHCMTPGYLENQLERSRQNLGVDAIDVYYLHNPETQLQAVAREEFFARVRAAFEFLELAVDSGRIRYYGMATWNAFRQAENAPDYVALSEMEILAREVAGDAHHFRFVQLPFNLAMTEAVSRANQPVDERRLPMIEAAHALEIALVASAALLQGQVAQKLPGFIAEALGLENDIERALQFARSVPGITTALVGMSHPAHVAANLRMVGVPLATAEQVTRLFQRGKSA